MTALAIFAMLVTLTAPSARGQNYFDGQYRNGPKATINALSKV